MTVPSFSPSQQLLWDEACQIREHVWDKQVFLRGIVEFSNHCRQNCLYCGLRRDNAKLLRYRMDDAAIYECAQTIHTLGFGTIVLQSGEDPALDVSAFAALIARIKQLGLAVTLSLGEHSRDAYRLWREAGADRYLLKCETTHAASHRHFRPGCALGDRLAALCTLRELGYETGSGLIFGLPDETPEYIQSGIALLASLHVDMVSLSPFIPHPDTPLHASPACSTAHILNGMALARAAMPTAHMPVTSALGLQGDAMRLYALRVADVLMASLTPETVRKAYTIYPGKNMEGTNPEQRALALKELLVKAGFCLPSGPGGAWRLEHGEEQ